MPALELGEEPGEVFVGAQVMPPVHPAALMFPTVDKHGVEGLRRDVMRDGLKNPVVLTPNGELLEGRGRWKACRSLDLVPRTRVERGDPWLYIINRNKVYLLDLEPYHRAMIVGRIPIYGASNRPRNSDRYEDPPTLLALQDAIGVGRQQISRAQRIFRDGVTSLHQLVITGACPIFTAYRVAKELSPEDQEHYVNRVLNGANPQQAAPVEERSEDLRRGRSKGTVKEFAVVRGRGRFVREQTATELTNTLRGVRMIVDSAEGLDPSVTPTQAAQLLKELASQHVAYKRLSDLLKQRKEEQ